MAKHMADYLGSITEESGATMNGTITKAGHDDMAREMCATKAEFWRLIRAANETGSGHLAALRVGREADRLGAEFCRRFYPRAGHAFAISDPEIGQPSEVYVQSPKGRSARVVWQG